MKIKASRVLKGQAAIARTSSSARTLKGQAAMEYLMTYGWAILVIVIVLAVLLFYLPQFLRAPESCIFGQAGFTCSDKKPTIYIPQGDSQVHLAINVFDGQGKSVTVHKTLCTSKPIGDVRNADGISVSDNATASISAGGSETYDVPCYNDRGGPLQIPAGSDFRGSFVLWYNFDDDVRSDINRQTYATVSGPVLQQ